MAIFNFMDNSCYEKTPKNNHIKNITWRNNSRSLFNSIAEEFDFSDDLKSSMFFTKTIEKSFGLDFHSIKGTHIEISAIDST